MDQDKQKTQGRRKMFAVLAICAAPMVASYFAYYVVKPSGMTNYGTLIDPRAYPIPALNAKALDGAPASLDAYKGKWIMLETDRADCQAACKEKLFKMRQLRLMQGKNMERIERVWLVTDDAPVETMTLREYDGTHVLRVTPDAVNKWLPVDRGAGATDHIYLIDPVGNLMMRFPKDADPNKMKKDLGRLLKASRIG